MRLGLSVFTELGFLRGRLPPSSPESGPRTWTSRLVGLRCQIRQFQDAVFGATTVIEPDHCRLRLGDPRRQVRLCQDAFAATTVISSDHCRLRLLFGLDLFELRSDPSAYSALVVPFLFLEKDSWSPEGYLFQSVSGPHWIRLGQPVVFEADEIGYPSLPIRGLCFLTARVPPLSGYPEVLGTRLSLRLHRLLSASATEGVDLL